MGSGLARTKSGPPSAAAAERQRREGRTAAFFHHAEFRYVRPTRRLPPRAAGHLDAALTARIMQSRPTPNNDQTWPTIAQQHADALVGLLREGTGPTVTEIVLHVRSDGCTLDDGTPIPSTVIERIAPTAFLRALIHDAEGNPIDASNKRRHPTTRQQRVVHERDRACVDCGRHDLLTTTTSLPGNRPTAPSSPSSNSAAPPATAAGTPSPLACNRPRL